MCRFTDAIVALALFAGIEAAATESFPGIGRGATANEIAAWDIDVRADFTGLPPGSGSVARGQAIWDTQCVNCHGVFGESNEVFTPLVGGTTPDDIETGRARTLATATPARTTLSKLSTVSTLWDYIRRAMPWTAPKSLTVDEVYAVTAYLLHLGDILPADYVLNQRNIAEVQARLPNRHGMTRAHGLWEIHGRPDVSAAACMKNCPRNATITSFLPDYARGDHGNLAEQNRLVGLRGVVTLAADSKPEIGQLAQRAGCLACHRASGTLVGPGFDRIAARYRDDANAGARLVSNVKNGSVGVWGPAAMPPHEQLRDDDVRALVDWILAGAK